MPYKIVEIPATIRIQAPAEFDDDHAIVSCQYIATGKFYNEIAIGMIELDPENTICTTINDEDLEPVESEEV